jgi:hypothetical protein
MRASNSAGAMALIEAIEARMSRRLANGIVHEDGVSFA